MDSLNEGLNIIDEVAYLFAVGYLRLCGIRDRCEPPILVGEPRYIIVETSPKGLDIPEMSCNL